jgi:hypothetical protein
MYAVHEPPSLVVPPIPARAVRIHVELRLSGMIYDPVVFFAPGRAAKDDMSLRLGHAGQAYAG